MGNNRISFGESLESADLCAFSPESHPSIRHKWEEASAFLRTRAERFETAELRISGFDFAAVVAPCIVNFTSYLRAAYVLSNYDEWGN